MDIMALFKALPNEVQSVIVSSVTAILILLTSSLAKFFYDKYSLNYKLKKEYIFEQRKQIKKEISKYKMRLLNASEELNYRFWNFTKNIDENWHCDIKSWKDPGNYYLHSFVYRFLAFLSWLIKTEDSIISFDSTVADHKDSEYIKFVKTLKNIFCDTLLLREFDYNPSIASNHFFKDHLRKFISYITVNDDDVLDFTSFQDKVAIDYSCIELVIKYFFNIKKTSDNINYNIIKEFHLLLLVFLNNFGHDYQITENKKMYHLLRDIYKTIKNYDDFYDYIIRSKLLRRFKPYLKQLR